MNRWNVNPAGSAHTLKLPDGFVIIIWQREGENTYTARVERSASGEFYLPLPVVPTADINRAKNDALAVFERLGAFAQQLR